MAQNNSISDFDIVDVSEFEATKRPSAAGRKGQQGGSPDANSPTSTEGTRSGDGDDFVVVTKPLLTARQFAEWLRDVRLPNAANVMTTCDGDGRNSSETDTVQVLIDRKAFLDDMLQSFKGKLVTGATGSPSNNERIELHAWRRLWNQFLRDFPREDFRIDGERLELSKDGSHCGSIESAAQAAEVEAVTLPRIRLFLSQRMPPDFHSRQHVRSPGGTDHHGRWPLSWLHEAVTGAVSGMLVSGFSTAKLVVDRGSRSESRHTADDAAIASRSSTSDTSLRPAPGERGFESDAANSPKETDSNPREVLIEDYTRLVILMAQQSVLALPFEIVNSQFCSDIDRELYVGEVSPADARSVQAGMKVNLTSIPSRDCGATMSVSKLFRIFSLADSKDYTLFYVRLKVELDLFAYTEGVSITWHIETADRPTHHVTKYTGVASEAAVIMSDAAVGTYSEANAVKCTCFGGSAGYHKNGCPGSP